MNIHDIAKRCGVSIATVSRVLNDSPAVSAKTRDKVLAVMQQEDYTPNAFARGLGLNSMRMVGILCTDAADLFYAKAVSLTERSLREKGFDTLLCCTGDREGDKQKYLSLLLEKRVDAVVLIGSAFSGERDAPRLRQAAAQVPVVLVNGFLPLPNVYCVLCDEGEAMLENVRALVKQGCERILYLYDAPTYSGQQKLAGYRAGIAEAGLSESILRVEKSVDSARESVFLHLSQDGAADAVLASEDLLAVGAQKALASCGFSPPIIGFNNSVYAQCASPALTSVDNMLETLCPTAVNLLADLLAGQEAPQKIVITARLAVRETFWPGEFSQQKGC